MERPALAPATPATFTTPEEEFAHLGGKVEAHETRFSESGNPDPRKAAAQEAVQEHRAAMPARVLEEAHQETEGVHLSLSPETHDEKMGELISILMERGAWAAMAQAEATQSPHIIDDFHRILVAYLSEGYGAKGLARGSTLAKSLSMVLYQVTLPEAEEEEGGQKKPLSELLVAMEQFYQSMRSIPRGGDDPNHFAFELANPVGSSTVLAYAAVPKRASDMFEKQMSAVFPKARIEWRPDDYNVFSESGYTVGAEGFFLRRPIYALKGYDEFEHDPIEGLLAAFGKLDREREGAVVQFLIEPTDHGLNSKFRHALERMAQGVPLVDATDIHTSASGKVYGAFKEFFFPPKRKEQGELRLDSDPRVKAIERKVATPIVHVNIRLVASGTSPERAAAILTTLESAFKQYADTAGNELGFKEVKRGSMMQFAQKVAYRMYDAGSALPLATTELTAIAHLPPREVGSAPEFLHAKAVVAPAPPDMPNDGVLVGINKYREVDREVHLPDQDRLRHLYIIGQTGAGKSTLLKNIIIQDIRAGAGVCMIDPHGSDVMEVLSAIPPERYDDIIYFDPGAIEHPMGLNMLEYDPRFPEQKSLVVDELLSIFKKLFGAIPESMGPAFEQYFRNAALLVMDDPSSGSTLLDISRIFGDPEFRALKLSRCKNPIVVQFWRGIAMQAGGEQSLENYGPYITSKFDVFTANDFMRPIIAQQQSAFDFRQIMDNKKILLVNLAKGRIGEMNANLLGLIIVGKFLIAALSRVDSFGKDLPPFYLHIDEFQNFTTNSIATILSEARKYKLSLTIAHQFIAQLTDEIRDAVFGNVGSLIAFRVGAEDAELLEKQFAPVFSARDLMNIDNLNAYARLLLRGRPEKPFSIFTPFFNPGAKHAIDQLRELSYLKYGKNRAEIEAEISARYQK